MTTLDSIIQEKMRSLGAATYKKFLQREVLLHWSQLVSSTISANVKPVKVENGKLYVEVKSSVVRDQLKYEVAEMIAEINAKLGEEVLNEMEIVSFVAKEEKLEEAARVETLREKIEATLKSRAGIRRR